MLPSRLARPALLAAALAVLPVLPASARAETQPEEAVALGWQTERADAVVLAAVVSARPAAEEGVLEVELRVDEAIRGPLAVGTSPLVRFESHGHAPPWREGLPHLCFLVRVPGPPGAPARYAPVTGAFGLRPLPPGGPEQRLPEVARALSATLAEDGSVADPDKLRSLLVEWLADPEPGIAWSGATDLVRHTELHAELSDAERLRVLAAYRAQPAGKRTKHALALAVAAARPPDAARALADSLLEPRAREFRVAVAEALRRLDDPASGALLADRLDRADPEARVNLLVALRAVGGAPAAAPVTPLLLAEEAEVRAEAAHTLGQLARNARDSDPQARLAVRDDLAGLLDRAETASERRAALWALAQLDDPEAFALLRRAAADDPRDDVRRAATEYLRRPRVSLVR